MESITHASIVGDNMKTKEKLDPIGVKKRLEDYEHMLQYYTLMRMKNKMKDFEAKSK